MIGSGLYLAAYSDHAQWLAVAGTWMQLPQTGPVGIALMHIQGVKDTRRQL